MPRAGSPFHNHQVKTLMGTASALLCAVAVAVTLGAAPAAALIRPQPYARVAAIAVPQDLSATSPAGNVSWGAPMALRRVGAPVSAVAIGTDEHDCTQKDASRANVAARPTRGFVAFRFAAPADAFYALEMQAYAPDSLANSFWLQWDEGPAAEFGTGKSRVVTSMPVELETAGGFVDACFRLAPGDRELRLYAREAGTAIAELAVDRVPALALNRTLGCAPCFRAATGPVHGPPPARTQSTDPGDAASQANASVDPKTSGHAGNNAFAILLSRRPAPGCLRRPACLHGARQPGRARRRAAAPR